MTGVSLENVRSFLRELTLTGRLVDNTGLKQQRMDAVDKLDDFSREALDKLVHQQFRKAATETNQPAVSIKTLHQAVLQDGTIPPMCRTTLRKMLHALGYRFMSLESDRNVMLIDKSEIVWWRKRYKIFATNGSFRSTRSMNNVCLFRSTPAYFLGMGRARGKARFMKVTKNQRKAGARS